MPVLIRKATDKEAAIIATLSRKTFFETFAAHNSIADMNKFMNEQFTEELLMNEVVEGNGYFYIAYDGGEAVGYARMRDGEKHDAFENKPSIEIARIYAVKESIGKGVGSALITKCLQEAKRLQRQITWLGVWEKNDRAIRFYEKWGFKKFGEHPFLLGDDKQTDWLMMRSAE